MGLEVMWVHTHMQRHKQHNEQCATQTPYSSTRSFAVHVKETIDQFKPNSN